VASYTSVVNTVAVAVLVFHQLP